MTINYVFRFNEWNEDWFDIGHMIILIVNRSYDCSNLIKFYFNWFSFVLTFLIQTKYFLGIWIELTDSGFKFILRNKGLNFIPGLV